MDPDHLIYLNEIERAAAAASLSYEAYKAFEDLFLLKHLDDLVEEAKRFELACQGLQDVLLHPPHMPGWLLEFLRVQHLEFLKIGCGFELALKSRLVNQGFLVHLIESGAGDQYKDLAGSQKKAPVRVDDLKALSGYMPVRGVNKLPGLSERTLSFETLLRARYLDAIGFSADLVETIKVLHKQRNAIHLPNGLRQNEWMKTKSIYSLAGVIKEFTRTHIVNFNRNLVERYGLIFAYRIEEYECNRHMIID